jgi:hypothetical protein
MDLHLPCCRPTTAATTRKWVVRTGRPRRIVMMAMTPPKSTNWEADWYPCDARTQRSQHRETLPRRHLFLTFVGRCICCDDRVLLSLGISLTVIPIGERDELQCGFFSADSGTIGGALAGANDSTGERGRRRAGAGRSARSTTPRRRGGGGLALAR